MNDDTTIRLQVFLSRCGVCSRRDAARVIAAKRVSVNGHPVTETGYRVRTDDTIILDGREIHARKKHEYFLLHKPVKVESTHARVEGRTTTAQLLQRRYKGSVYGSVFCAGRLDYMSSGLMLYTTDGDLTYRLTHPRYGVEKTYEVRCSRPVPEHALKSWARGVKIQGVRYTLRSYAYADTFASIRVRKNTLIRGQSDTPEHTVQLTLTEGKNREIRIVLAHFGLLIKTLRRIRLGIFTLGALPVGEVMKVPPAVVARARESVGLSDEQQLTR